jgi:hypothetical protein
MLAEDFDDFVEERRAGAPAGTVLPERGTDRSRGHDRVARIMAFASHMESVAKVAVCVYIRGAAALGARADV